MRRRATVVVALLVSGGALAAVAPFASAASPQAKKIPAACVQHKLPAHLNLQVGYCP
jgi:hypothetical protein